MGLLITNQVSTSIGEDMTNLWASVVFHTQELLITGKVQCDIKFYKSEADADAGADPVYPVVNGQKVTNCTITVALSDVIKVGAGAEMSDVVAYFYSKVEEYLEANYVTDASPALPWAVTVE